MGAAQCTKNIGERTKERKVIDHENSLADAEPHDAGVAISTREAQRMLVLQERLKKYPNNSGVASELAELLYRNGFREASQILINKVIMQGGANERTYYIQGLIFAQRKQWLKALEALQHAAQRHSYLPQAHAKIAEIHSKIGNLEKALNNAEKAVKMEPNNADYLETLGGCLLSLDRSEQALVCLQKALKIDGKDPRIHNSLANAYRRLKKNSQAIAHYERAVVLSNERGIPFPVAQLNLADACFEEGDLQKCIKALAEVDATTPPVQSMLTEKGYDLIFRDVRVTEGVLAYFDGKLDYSQAVLQETFNLDPQNIVCAYFLSRVFSTHEKSRWTRFYLEKTVELGQKLALDGQRFFSDGLARMAEDELQDIDIPGENEAS